MTKRLYYLDNLKVGLTALLIAHHVGQAYGPTGGTWPIQEASRSALLGPFFTVNRSFFMSLFFLISGFFTAMSYDGKNPRAFLRSRLLRLGIPVLVFGLLMVPLQLFVFKPEGSAIGTAWPIDVGYMWYVEHLLLFSLGYAAWRALWARRKTPVPVSPRPPRFLTIVLFALAVAAASALVRTWYPIDRWLILLGFFRVALADVPRDLGFFLIGVLAYRRQWLTTFSARAGRVWLLAAALLAGFWYAYDLWLYRVLPMSDTTLGVVYPIWEALLCASMCIGLLVFFRERLDFQGRLGKALGQSQYAAYIFHVPVVLTFQLAFLATSLPPFAKFALVTLVSVPLTFLVSYFVHKPLHL